MEVKFSPELVALLYALLPGFTAAWVFHSFTAHKRSESTLERTVQALIFTGFTLVLADPTKRLLIGIGTRYWSLGPWNDKTTITVGMALGILMGLVASWLANNSLIHRCCSHLGITKRTSFSSEWYSVFHRAKESFVYLNFKDGRRIFGWAEQYPDDPEKGHFVLTDVAYPTEQGTFDNRPLIDRILIPVGLIETVEFEKPNAATIKVGLFIRMWRVVKKLGTGEDENVKRIVHSLSAEADEDPLLETPLLLGTIQSNFGPESSNREDEGASPATTPTIKVKHDGQAKG